MALLSHDVLIIGAGAAGLAAAAALARAGMSVLVLEARERTGGRVWSLDAPGLPVPVELGAEFIHGRPAETFDLLRRAGMAAVDRTGDGWYVERGKLKPMGDIFAELRAALRKARAPRRDVSFDTFLRGDLRGLSARARAFARRRVEGYDAADPARASARAILEEWKAEDEATAPAHFRPSGGYGRLIGWLAGTFEGSRVQLRTGSVVHEVSWKHGRVEVRGLSRGKPMSESARRAIVTLPLGVLKLPNGAAGAVRFMPELAAKQRALDGLAPSPVIKVVLRFRDAFWEKRNGGCCANAAFLRAPDADLPSFWTALPVRVPLLVAWAGGPRAERLSKMGTQEIIGRAVRSLESVFGKRAGIGRRLEAAWLHDWQQDPFARGAYSYMTVGGHGARKALAAPLANTLFFAGEATDSGGQAGTVAGALRSGARAARQLLEAEGNRGTNRQNPFQNEIQ